MDRVGWPRDGGRLLDPSCGDGAFLLAALDRLNIRTNDPESVSRVHGYEIHPGAVADARSNIETWLISRGWSHDIAAKTAYAMVTEADFLTDFPEQDQYDLILGNPPYLRYHYVPQYFRDLYREKLPSVAQGDLLHGFLFKCTQVLKDDGIIGLITSDRWISNETCGLLRARLGDLVGIDHIARLSNETSFYRPKRRVTGSLPRVHPIEVVMRPKAYSLRPLSQDPISIDLPLSEHSRTLGDIAEVRLGPWLSKPGTFAIQAAVAERLVSKGLHGARLIPVVVGKERDVDWENNCIFQPCEFYALLTDPEVTPTGAVAEHLLSTAWMHSERAKRPQWWLPPEMPRLEDIQREKLIIPGIANKLRSARVPAGTLVIDHHVMVFPKSGYTLQDIEEALEQPATQNAWRSLSKPIENGYWQTGAKALRTLPV